MSTRNVLSDPCLFLPVHSGIDLFKFSGKRRERVLRSAFSRSISPVTPIFANPFREAEFRYQRKSSNIIIERPKLLVSRLDTQFLAPEQAMAEREIQMLIDQRVSGDALGQGDLAARGHW
jgi:hypothetical protein